MFYTVELRFFNPTIFRTSADRTEVVSLPQLNTVILHTFIDLPDFSNQFSFPLIGIPL